ncbi:MAG TPA: DUF58 domain-containing protein, partial [Euzebya sp.]|nr:DUF58 domain-containing protein [Euzebya sp.]
IQGVVELRNDARLPSPTLLVTEQLPAGFTADGHPVEGQARFVLAALAPARLTAARYTAVAGARGRYGIGPLQVRVRDPFGAAERVRRYTATTDLIVYPRVDVLPESPIRGAHMGSGSSDTRRVSATGEEFYTMREYVRGDDLRHVHWASTAHRQTLMVRQMEQPWQAHATVYLDARVISHTPGPHGTLEKAVSLAASVVHHLAARGYVLRLMTQDSVGRGGPTPWQQAMDRLAVLAPSPTTGLGPSLAASRGGEGLFVAVLGVSAGGGDLTHHPDMRALFAVRGFGQRLALVVTPAAEQRAARMTGLLRGAGWQAVTVQPGQAPAGPWRSVTQARARRGVVVR